MLGDHRVHQILCFFVFSVLTGRRATTNAASHGSGGHSDNSGSSNSWIGPYQHQYYNRFLDDHNFYGVDTFRPPPPTNANRNVRPTPTNANRTGQQAVSEESNRIALWTPPPSAASSPGSGFAPLNSPNHSFYGENTFRPPPPTPTTGNRTGRHPAYNPSEESNRIALRTPPLSAANSPESRFNPTNTPQFPSPPAVGSQHQGVFLQGYDHQYSGMGQVSVSRFSNCRIFFRNNRSSLQSYSSTSTKRENVDPKTNCKKF